MRKILLSTSAVLMASSFASAADLPVVEPVDYVRVCDAFGTGFHYIPGTETCLKFSGRVRAELGYADDWNDNDADDATFMNSNFELVVNASSMTEIGMISGQFSISSTHDNSVDDDGNSTSGVVNMDDAWITIGENLLVGREISSFDFGGGYGYYGGYYGDAIVEQFTFIMPFGNGFSATLGLEDNRDRRSVDHKFLAAGTLDAVTLMPSDLYGGMEIPDVVASLRLSQGWGSAHLSGALHQISISQAWQDLAAVAPLPIIIGDQWGWAMQAGVELHMGSSTSIKVVGAYADNALAYLGGGMHDWDFKFANNSLAQKTNTGWYVLAGIEHGFSDKLVGSFNSSFNRFNDGDDEFSVQFFAAESDPTYTGLAVFNHGFDLWQVDGTLEYEVVKNLFVGVGAKYQHYNQHSDITYLVEDGELVSENSPWTEDDDAWEVKMRVQRNF